ncbi:protein boule-like isoform X1 [Hydra vulgaris]|uniref:protein boule-like isoform X1 n=1 Tax=Hydra vulgaris TaxID=6087 RepID=UPI0006413793|nr:protein boule-like isoform X1 [Hydra vulgaris]
MADVVKYGIQIANRVFVGGVAFDTKEEELKDFFSQYGKVKECKIIKDNQSISRGFAFVTFECKQDAVKTQQLGTVFFNQKKLNLGPAIRQKGVVFNGTKEVENEPVLSTGVYIHPSGYSYTVAPNGVWYFHNSDGKPPTRVPGSPPMAYAPNILQRRRSSNSQTEQTILLRQRQTPGECCSSPTCESLSPTSVNSSPDVSLPIFHGAPSAEVQPILHNRQVIQPTIFPPQHEYVQQTPFVNPGLQFAFQSMSISSPPSCAQGLTGNETVHQIHPPPLTSFHGFNGTSSTHISEMYLPYYQNKILPGNISVNNVNNPQQIHPLHYHYNFPVQKTECYMVPPICINPIKDTFLYPLCADQSLPFFFAPNEVNSFNNGGCYKRKYNKESFDNGNNLNRISV